MISGPDQAAKSGGYSESTSLALFEPYHNCRVNKGMQAAKHTKPLEACINSMSCFALYCIVTFPGGVTSKQHMRTQTCSGLQRILNWPLIRWLIYTASQNIRDGSRVPASSDRTPNHRCPSREKMLWTSPGSFSDPRASHTAALIAVARSQTSVREHH
jgi:hypothetical protein